MMYFFRMIIKKFKDLIKKIKRNKNSIAITDDELVRYIIFDLPKEVDGKLFNCETFIELGKRYFELIQEKAPEKTQSSIIEIVNNICSRAGISTCDGRSSVYENICKMLQIESFPKKHYEIISAYFDEKLVNPYQNVCKEYSNEIDALDKKSANIDSQISNITKFDKSYILKDFSPKIMKLKELYREQNRIRAQKDTIFEYQKVIDKKINEYCDLGNPDSVSQKAKEAAIDCSFGILSTKDVQEIIDNYKRYIDVLNYMISSYENVFFDIKFYPFIQMAYKTVRGKISENQNEALEEYRQINKTIEDKKKNFLHLHSDNRTLYLAELKKYILDENIIQKITDLNLTLITNRREILAKALELYQQKEYIIVINILPIQIEGLFSDLLDDIKSINNASKASIDPSGDLKKKVDQIFENIPAEYAIYFKHCFNDLIRNTTAHGRTITISDEENEISANELLLDLYSLLYMISRYSETEKMCRFIHSYSVLLKSSKKNDDMIFECLYNDLCGQRTHLDYDMCEHYSFDKVILWIVNPYFENLYMEHTFTEEEKNDYLKLRQILLGKDFWNYVKQKLNRPASLIFDSEKTNISSIVTKMFSCGVSNETKDILISINSSLSSKAITRKK